MKCLTPSSLLACAAFACVSTIPFLPLSKSDTALFALEVRMSANTNGSVQVYYDRGRGLSEAESSRLSIVPGNEVVLYRLPLPEGRFSSLRFDPVDREGTASIESLRIVNANGGLVRALGIADLVPANEIASIREKDGRIEVVAAAAAEDPQLSVTFSPRLRLRASPFELFSGFIPRALGVFAVLAALLVSLDRIPGFRSFFRGIGTWGGRHPLRAVAAVSLAAVVASAWPVVFLGKSFVSPNLGAGLLYGEFPTLPGNGSRETGDVKGSDIGAIFWAHGPYSMVQHEALLEDGELPLWNRYNSAGTPLLGQGQSMFGDPVHLLPILANGASWAWDLNYLVSRWIFAAGIGLLVLAVSRHLPSALAMCLSAPFIGFYIYRINHPAVFSLGYAPWVLYCWLRAAQAEKPRSAAAWAAGAMAANFCLMNSGTVKEAYMLLLSMNLSGACLVLAAGLPWRQRLARLGMLAGAGAILVLLSAPIWLTFLDTLKRSYTSYNAASAFQIQPGLLLGAFDELFYRPLMLEERVFNPSTNFAVLIGLLYFLATLRHHFSNRIVMAVAASSLFPLAMAFGLVPGRWIVHVPFLANVAHIDNSFTCALLVLWPVLAGAGIRTAAERLGRPEGRGDLAVAGVLLFGLVFAWIASGQSVQRQAFGADGTASFITAGHELPVSLFIWIALAALVGASALVALAARGALRKGAFTSTSALLIALGAVVLLWRHGLQPGAAGFSAYTQHPLARADFHAESEAVRFVQEAQKREPARTVGVAWHLAPGWTAAYKLEGISGPDALMNPFYRELTGAGPVERVWDWRLNLSRQALRASRPFLDFLNVRFYFDRGIGQTATAAGLKLDKEADLDVYESPTAWPRAFFTDRVVTYNQPADLVRSIAAGDGRPFAAVQAADAASIPGGIVGEGAGRTVVPADNYRLTSNSTSFEIHATAPGVAVLSEVHWPGDFRAEVNGSKAILIRLNHAFKGVVLPGAGDFRVSIFYRPRRYQLALELFIAGCVLAAAGGAAFWLTRPRPGAGAVG